MKNLLTKEVLLHPIVLAASGIVVVMAIASVAYYELAAQVPVVSVQAAATTTDPQFITATGIVSPSQNPDLSFQSGGRVVSVSVKVGSQVGKGAVLASLDTAALSAARDQAAANVRAQEARLADMKAGPREVDLSQKQTAVAQAQQTLADLYQSASNDIASNYSAVLGDLHADIDLVYSNPNSASPTLLFYTSDNQLANSAIAGRIAASSELSAWAGVTNPAPDATSTEAALATALAHAIALRSYADTMTQVLASALTSTSFSQAQLTTAQADLAVFRAAAQSAVTTLQADQRSIASAKLAIQSAQDALAQAQAGSTEQQIEAQAAAVDAAQASLEAANAALQNAIIVAPYDGTVTAVPVKVGDTVSQNTVAVSLSPHSALELDAYLSELDAARVAAGDPASVTLDAYGTGRAFPATVVSVDRSPTMQNGVPAHKVVVQFSEDDAALSPGMTGNVTITPSH